MTYTLLEGRGGMASYTTPSVKYLELTINYKCLCTYVLHEPDRSTSHCHGDLVPFTVHSTSALIRVYPSAYLTVQCQGSTRT